MRRAAISGFAWTGLQTLILQALTLVTQLVLARLLTPDLFGVIAVAATISAICATLADSGLSAAVVRKQNLSRRYLETAWWLNLGFGIALGCGLILLARPLSAALGEPQLAQVLPLYSLTVAITSITSVPLSVLQRRMAFLIRAAVTVPAAICGAVAAVAMALVSPTVWALAIQPLVGAAVTALVLLVMRAYVVGRNFDQVAAKEMLRFGLPLAASSTIDTLWNGLPAIFLTASLGPISAGIYFMADRMRGAIVTTVFSALSTVAFPAFAAVSEERRRFRAYVRSAIRSASALTAPVFLVVASQAANIFDLILPPSWQAGAPYLSIMMVGALMYPLNSINIAAMKAAGRSRFILVLEVFKKAIALACLVWLLPQGIDWYLWGMLVFGIVAYIPNSWFAARELGYRYREQVRDAGIPFLIAALFSLALVFADMAPNIPTPVVVFVFSPIAILGAWTTALLVYPSVRRELTDRIKLRSGKVRAPRARSGRAAEDDS